MNGLWATLPGAALAGLGAVLCTMGYRQIRFQAMTVGICAFAAGGAAIGALFGYPAFAAGLFAAGAALRLALPPQVFHVYFGPAPALCPGPISPPPAPPCPPFCPIFLSGPAA